MLSEADKAIAEVAIGGLVQRYAEAVDLHLHDAYVACFTEDGEFSRTGGAFKGREAIGEAMGQTGNVTRRHFFMPPIVEFTSDTTATGRGFIMILEHHGEAGMKGPYPVDYKDEYRKTSEGWLLSKRTVGRAF